MKKATQIRFLIGFLLIVGLLYGYKVLKNVTDDPDPGEFTSVGYVAALEMTKQGGRVVLFDENGKRIEPNKPAKDGSSQWEDREVSWSVDGQRIFMSSTRESDSFLVYRWNPDRQDISKRAIGSRSQSAPWFGPFDDPDAKKLGLIQSGGQILEINIKTGTTKQILPPAVDETAAAEEGRRGTMEVLYGKFGESFVKARYAGNKNDLVAIMLNDEGQTAILHRLGFNNEGQLNRPIEIFRGKKVAIDVAPDGRVAMMVRNMTFPDQANIPSEFIKDGKVTKPFESGIFVITIGEDGFPKADAIAVLPFGSEESFGDIAVSPDGSKIAVVVGVSDGMGGFTPSGLMTMPFETNGGGSPSPVIGGQISSPSWSSDGKKLTYLKTEGSDTDVFVIGVDGSGERKLTSGGTYAMPQFSPQVAK
ncbi:MAG: PD40 domain-containing protein [Fimbriimonadaceae bacterium]|nr:MAG: PD40 domain-containing protein [Fimbriimonadaceae bacterium]